MDKFCKITAKGTHCLGTNYLSGLPLRPYPIETVPSETEAISTIRSLFEQEGYQLGKDFIEKQTKHRLYDFKGRPLNSRRTGDPITVNFNALVVNTGMLRSVLAKPNRFSA